MEIKVLSCRKAGEFEPGVPTAAMRIFGTTSWDRQYPYPLRNSPLYVATFEYRFDDVRPSDLTPMERTMKKYTLIDEQISEIMVNDFMKVKDRIKGLMIHCFAGLGRSAGAASGLNDAFSLGQNSREWQGERTNFYVMYSIIHAAERMRVGRFGRV